MKPASLKSGGRRRQKKHPNLVLILIPQLDFEIQYPATAIKSIAIDLPILVIIFPPTTVFYPATSDQFKPYRV